MQESISSLMGDEESCTAHYMVESVTASVHQFKRVHTACYNFSLHLPAATVALGYTSLKEDASALVIHLTSFAAEISVRGNIHYGMHYELETHELDMHVCSTKGDLITACLLDIYICLNICKRPLCQRKMI